MIKHGFYFKTDQEMVFIARQSKLDSSKFKLVRTQFSSLTQGWITISPTFYQKLSEKGTYPIFGGLQIPKNLYL